jgi:predicted DNA-binding transcriptional regulator AlpA
MSVQQTLARIEQRLETVERLLTDQTDEVLDVDALQAMTGISRSAIYQKTCSRNGEAPELPHFKRGKRLYFRRSEIVAWMTEHRVKDRSQIEQEAANFSIRSRRNAS